MALGGPETPLALGQQGIDEAMLAATSQSMGIAGVDQPVADTRGRVNIPPPAKPAGQGQFSFDVQPADYGYRMTQDDFGQKPVAQLNTPSGPVPVAQQGLPFPALAGRQSALAERKAELQKQAMAFDPFKGISDPADPYQTTFNQYIRDEYGRKRNDMAQASFGGDTAAFDKWVAGTPEGQMWMRTNFTMPMDAIAKENKGRVETIAKFLTEAQQGKWSLSPEQRKALHEYTTLINDIGAPLSGVDARELLLKGRAAEQIIHEATFEKQYMQDFDGFAKHLQVMGKAMPVGGGRYHIREEDKKLFDDYKDQKADQAASLGMFGGSRDEARKWMDKLIKDRVEVKKFDAWEANKGGSGSGGANTPAGTKVSFMLRPNTAYGESVAASIGTKVGNSFVPPKPQPVYVTDPSDPDRSDKQRTMANPIIDVEDGKWVIRGSMLDDAGEMRLKEIEQKKSFIMPDDPNSFELIKKLEQEENSVIQKFAKQKSVDVLWNQDFMHRNTGFYDPAELYAHRLGVSADEVRRMAFTKEGQQKMRKMLKLMDSGVPEQSAAPAKAATSTTPTPAEFNAGWAKLKSGQSMVGPDGKTYIKQ